MAYTGCGAQHHGLFEFPGHAKCGPRHFVGFLGCGRFQAGQMRKARIAPVVLFVLAGMAAGIVSAQDDKAARQNRCTRP